ncbi:MAG: Fic family protein [Rubricoccaceae bacterium]
MEHASTVSGRYVKDSSSGETVRAFIPDPLPPDLKFSLEDYGLIGEANRALGRLDAFYSVAALPEGFADLLTYHSIRKEAVLSSQIEGTQSSFADLLLHEDERAPSVPLDDVEEVSSYVSALNYGLKRLDGGFLLSLRLLREIHSHLLAHGRGADKNPGEFRRSQVWLGGQRPSQATFVPPPPAEVMACLDPFEHFLHDPSYPAVLKAGLAHVQFETIHPFLDGNGRLGRLLITLLFAVDGVLAEPVLYLSLYFKATRQTYYEHLQRVRTHGDWEGWLRYFLRGILEMSEQALATAQDALALFEHDRATVSTFGRGAASALEVYAMLQHHPITTAPVATERLDLSAPTVRAALQRLETAGIVEEVTGGDRGRLYVYTAYLNLLDDGTEPL